MFQTIVHQTVEDREGPDQIENHGPIKCEKGDRAYLGNGYYFWDNHFELAVWWGDHVLRSEYMICESELSVDWDLFFDLMGNREHMIYLEEVRNKFNLGKRSIGTIIEFLIELSNKPGGEVAFPFGCIRAVDNFARQSFSQNAVTFVDGKRGVTNLSPMAIVCIKDKNKVNLRDFRVVYPENYAA